MVNDASGTGSQRVGTLLRPAPTVVAIAPFITARSGTHGGSHREHGISAECLSPTSVVEPCRVAIQDALHPAPEVVQRDLQVLMAAPPPMRVAESSSD